jgi:hypothetical protein
MVYQFIHLRLCHQPSASLVVRCESEESRVTAHHWHSPTKGAYCRGTACPKVVHRHHKSNAMLYSPSLSIQRTNRRPIPNLNSAPLLLIRIRKRRPQPALTLRHSQPQPHQMPPHPLPPLLVHTPRRPILISSPSMQHMAISQQLNIARLQNHMQRQSSRRFFQNCQRVQLRFTQRRNHSVWAGVVACERGNVVWIDFVPDAAAVAFGVEDAGDVPWILAFADFAFAVEVPVWGCESFDHVWVGLLQGVVDVVRGSDV